MWRAGLPAAPTSLPHASSKAHCLRPGTDPQSHATGTAHWENKPTFTLCLWVPLSHHSLGKTWAWWWRTSLFPCQHSPEVPPRRLCHLQPSPSKHSALVLLPIFVQRTVIKILPQKAQWHEWELHSMEQKQGTYGQHTVLLTFWKHLFFNSAAAFIPGTDTNKKQKQKQRPHLLQKREGLSFKISMLSLIHVVCLSGLSLEWKHNSEFISRTSSLWHISSKIYANDFLFLCLLSELFQLF